MFGEPSVCREMFGAGIDQPKGYSLANYGTDDSSNSPNFLPAKLSRYTVLYTINNVVCIPHLMVC